MITYVSNLLALNDAAGKKTFWAFFLFFSLSLNGPANVSAAGALRTAIIFDDSTVQKVTDPDERDRLSRRPSLWKHYLSGLDIDAKILDDRALEGGQLGSYELLILPEVPRLTARGRDTVLEFMRGGNFVILTGRTGSGLRDSDSENTLAQKLALDYSTLPRIEGSNRSVVLDRPSALNAGIPRLQHLPVEAEYGVGLPPSGQSVAFWLSEGSLTGMGKEAIGDAAITQGDYGDGKFLWLGFTLDSMGGDIESGETFHRLILNALKWFQGLPTVEIAPWPFPYINSIIFSMDVEEQFANIRRVHALEELESITYFILTSPAAMHMDFIRQLSKDDQRGDLSEGSEEIALHAGFEVAVHGDNHDVFPGQPPALQAKRLAYVSERIKEVAGKDPIGFRPPEEAYDFYTLREAVNQGYKYLFANNSPDRAQPLIKYIDGNPLVQFTMLNRDDVKLITMLDDPTPKEVLESAAGDMDFIFDREGLYILNFHSHIMATSKYIGVLRDLISRVDSRGAWVVNCREMMDWWLKRDNVGLETIERGKNLLHFKIFHSGQERIEDLALDVWLPVHADSLQVERLSGGGEIRDYFLDGERLRLHMSPLKPGDRWEFRLLWGE